MKLIKLLHADMFRDGGSFAAGFETDEGTGYGLLLERSRMPDEDGLHHGPLYAFIDAAQPFNMDEPPDGCPSLVPGSADERSVLRLVDDFLREPAVKIGTE